MRGNHKWAARKRRPINPIILLQAIFAGVLFIIGFGIVALTLIAAGA